MKTNREKKSTSTTMNNEAFAKLEQSLKEALAYEKGEITSLRITAIPLAPKQRSKTAILDLRSKL
ncbi:MAG: hypothetical protein WAQ98_21620 [Blastocatellia bacterium]